MFKFLLRICSDYLTKLLTFRDHFFDCPGLFAGYSRQEVNISRTITANRAVRQLLAAYSPDIRNETAFP